MEVVMVYRDIETYMILCHTYLTYIYIHMHVFISTSAWIFDKLDTYRDGIHDSINHFPCCCCCFSLLVVQIVCCFSVCQCVCVWLFFLVLLLLFPRLCCASYDLFDSHANILHNFNSLPSSSFTSAAAFSFTFFSSSPLLSSGAAAAAVFALASVTASVSVSVSASLPTSRPFASRARFLASNLLTFN